MRNCSIIILNWNSSHLLHRCLTHVFNNTSKPYNLIIVDNGSTKDGSKEYMNTLINTYPELTIVYNAKNLGFAGGVNSGMDVASTISDICLLNVDAMVQKGWLEALYETMSNTPKCGLVGPLGNDIACRFQCEGMTDKDIIVPNLHFFCVLIRREVVDKIGLFDIQYGLGTYDDNDYGTRARLAGYVHCISAKSLVEHEAHQVFRLNEIDWDRLEIENREKFLNKFFGIMLDYSQIYDFFYPPEKARSLGLIILKD